MIKRLRETDTLVLLAIYSTFNAYLNNLQDYLSDDEKEKIHLFKCQKFREKYIINKALLRLCLAYFLDQKPYDIKFKYNKYGKPSLDKLTSRLKFNLSHSKDMIALIFALDREVGIDIEWVNKDLNINDMAGLVLSNKELIFFTKLNKEEKIKLFFDIWTKKEAIIKAIGYGLSYPIRSLEVIASEDTRGNSLHFALGKEYNYFALNNIADYAGAVAKSSSIEKIIQQSIYPENLLSLI